MIANLNVLAQWFQNQLHILTWGSFEKYRFWRSWDPSESSPGDFYGQESGLGNHSLWGMVRKVYLHWNHWDDSQKCRVLGLTPAYWIRISVGRAGMFQLPGSYPFFPWTFCQELEPGISRFIWILAGGRWKRCCNCRAEFYGKINFSCSPFLNIGLWVNSRGSVLEILRLKVTKLCLHPTAYQFLKVCVCACVSI